MSCVYLASYWHGALKEMSESIKEAKIEPWFDPDNLKGALVLTIDKLLPADFELSPEVVAGVGTSAIVVQRFLNSKAIKEALDRKKMRESGGLQEIKARAAEPPPAPPAPPPPAADPAPVHDVPKGKSEIDRRIEEAIAAANARRDAEAAEAAAKATLDPITTEPPRYPDGKPYDVGALG